MTAFNRGGHRRTQVFGTRAELTGDGETIRVYDFLTGAERLITPEAAGGMNAEEGHGGGDAGLMDAFTAAVATGNRALISSGPRESLASHLAVFAAERARLNGTVETIPPYAGKLSRTGRVAAQPPTTCTRQVWPRHGVDTSTSRPALVSRTV
jgi:hypothetical protein